MDNPSNAAFRIIHGYRKELDKIRYHVLPLQQIIDSMELSESPLINQSTTTFLKNFRNHVTQVIDRIDTLSNRITELRDIYNSSMSRKLDVTVRILTVVSCNICPFNFYCWNVWDEFSIYARASRTPCIPHCFNYKSFTIAIAMLIYFKRKNWI